MSEASINDSDFTEGEYDSLFGGEKLMSLFNKTHGVGTELSGVITEPPKQRHSRFYAADGKGALKYWGEDNKPTKDTRDKDGKPLKPVMDEVFILQTEYRADARELAKRDIDEDSGLRGVFAGGDDLRAIKQAIRKARVKNRAALVGMTLALKRVDQVVKGEFEAWVWEARLSGTPAAPKDVFADE